MNETTIRPGVRSSEDTGSVSDDPGEFVPVDESDIVGCEICGEVASAGMDHDIDCEFFSDDRE
jgi:hypothetical protein